MQNQSTCNIGAPKDEAQRKRFDSFASPTMSNQPSPSNLSASSVVRARPDLRADCWNSPLCPRNMAANDIQDSILSPDCGPAKSQHQTGRITNAVTEVYSPDSIAQIQNQDREGPTKRIKPNPQSEPSEDNDTTATPSTSSKPSTNPATDKRLPHHIIERRYRENLNTSIEHLRAAVPTATIPCLSPDMEDIGGSNPNAGGIRPLSKAGVIAHAAEYMRQLAAQNEEVERANREMRVTVEALRRLVNCEDCGVVQRIVDAGSGGC